MVCILTAKDVRCETKFGYIKSYLRYKTILCHEVVLDV